MFSVFGCMVYPFPFDSVIQNITIGDGYQKQNDKKKCWYWWLFDCISATHSSTACKWIIKTWKVRVSCTESCNLTAFYKSQQMYEILFSIQYFIYLHMADGIQFVCIAVKIFHLQMCASSILHLILSPFATAHSIFNSLKMWNFCVDDPDRLIHIHVEWPFT